MPLVLPQPTTYSAGSLRVDRVAYQFRDLQFMRSRERRLACASTHVDGIVLSGNARFHRDVTHRHSACLCTRIRVLVFCLSHMYPDFALANAIFGQTFTNEGLRRLSDSYVGDRILAARHYAFAARYLSMRHLLNRSASLCAGAGQNTSHHNFIGLTALVGGEAAVRRLNAIRSGRDPWLFWSATKVNQFR